MRLAATIVALGGVAMAAIGGLMCWTICVLVRAVA